MATKPKAKSEKTMKAKEEDVMGLTAGQKKLPPALQSAILKKKKKK
jgi:hypothetical protein